MTNIDVANQKPKTKGWVIALVIIGCLIVLYVIGTWMFQGLSGSSLTSGISEQSSPASYSALKSSDLESSESALNDQDTSSDANLSTKSAERMVIKDATLSMVVSDIENAADKISSYAEEKKGYIVSSNIYNPLDQPRSTITLRVPVDTLEESIEYYKTLADKVVSETLSSDDITDQYTDLQAKLKNYEATESQLKEIMKQASTVEEILKVQNQLTSIREKIELIKGQMEYLEKNVQMSKISITLALDESSLPVVSEKWRPWTQVKSAFRSLLSVLRWLSYLIIWIIVFGIIWLPIWLIIKWRKKIKDQKLKI